jgi:hypothetical protein
MKKSLGVLLLVFAIMFGLAATAARAAQSALAGHEFVALDSDSSSGPRMPAQGMTACADCAGCIAAALPVPAASFLPLAYGVVAFAALVTMLRGRSVEPELFPPIVPA